MYYDLFYVRCYEENDFPYFLNILSERYGWVPGETDVDPDIEEKYKWLPQLSVTAMEIATGAYWSRNPNVRTSTGILI